MKYRFWIISAVLSVLFNKSIAQVAGNKFRVVGYVRESAVANGDAFKINFDKITHLNIAFLNPSEQGRLNDLDNLEKLVVEAHRHHVKVLASIGGGLAPVYYTSLLMNTNRPLLIRNLLNFTGKYNLDGLDIDLEGDRIDSNYEAFVTDLSAAMKPVKKLLTAAVATVYALSYTDRSLESMDFINVMSYDRTGPWKPAAPGAHAPYEMAVDDLDYWITSKGISKDKVTLGLPFYGYGFGENAPEDMSYKDLIKMYPPAKALDEITVDGGGVIYYNGTKTIEKKTRLALQRGGGVMIWQLLQDATGDDSLLTLINKVISESHY